MSLASLTVAFFNINTYGANAGYCCQFNFPACTFRNCETEKKEKDRSDLCRCCEFVLQPRERLEHCWLHPCFLACLGEWTVLQAWSGMEGVVWHGGHGLACFRAS